MPIYRKKHNLVHATQWHPGVALEGVTLQRTPSGMDVPGVEAPEGFIPLSPGDYVVAGSDGCFHAYNGRLFEAHYEPVEG